MRRTLALIAAVFLTVGGAGPAQAQAASAVSQARSAGIVGERYDGYLGLVVDRNPMLRHQVVGINIRRRALYADLAIRRGVTLQEVGITAACQLLGTVGVGQRYLLSDNIWRLRAAGEGLPIPDYCR